MKYLGQMFIILAITVAAEILKALLPLPIPASIYGLVLILIALVSGLIKLEKIEGAAGFLLDIMPLFFVPALVGSAEVLHLFKGLYLQTFLLILITTILVMGITGRVSQAVIRIQKRKKQ